MNKGETWVIEYKENNKVLYSLKIEDLIEFCKTLEVEDVRIEDTIVPLITKDDLNKIENSDLNIPIILLKSPVPLVSNKCLKVLDGSHRLRKAYLRKQKTIKAVILRLEDKRIPYKWRELFRLKMREWSVKAFFIKFNDLDKENWYIK